MIVDMDKWNGYPDAVLVAAYVFTGFCSAGAFHLSLKGMALITAACVLQAVFMVLSGKAGMHLFLRRMLGAFIPVLAIVILRRYVTTDDTMRQFISSAILPIASGTTIVEGLCHAHKPAGRKMIIDGIIIALCLAVGAFAAVKAGGLLA